MQQSLQNEKKILRKLVYKNLQARKLDKLFSSYIHCIDYYVNRNALFVVTSVISSSIVLTSEVYEKKNVFEITFPSVCG